MAVIGTSDINLQDIGNVLNEAGGNVDINNPLTFFTEDANINKWALYKPFIYPQDFFESTDDYLVAAKKKNFGFTIPESSLGSSLSSQGWNYSLPKGGDSQPMRLGDFRQYNTDAICPMKVVWYNEDTDMYVNTLNTSTLPYIRVFYKLNDTIYHTTMGRAEITLNDVNLSGVTTNTIGGYVVCVVAQNSELGTGVSAIRVANAEDTLDLRFETNISDYVINLGNFNIIDAAIATTAGNFPEGAINKRLLTLYPKINKYTPSAKGQVYSTSADNPTTAPSSTKGGNGYVPAGVNNQFISIPEGGVLRLWLYERSTIQVNYAYVSITNGSTVLVGMWPYLESSLNYDASGVANLGGKTINYNQQQVIVKVLCTVYNIDENADAIIGPRYITDARGVFPKYAVTMQDSSGSTITSGQVTIPAKGYVNLYFVATYSAGAADNFTFPSLTSPSYGTSTPRISLRQMTSNGWGSEFTPPQYNNSNKELRWR